MTYSKVKLRRSGDKKTMNEYGESVGTVVLILNMDGGKGPSSRSDRFTPGKMPAVGAE